MTKRVATNMTPLVDDPSQPSYVRELLDAGRTARVSGYDFEQGLAVHAGRVAAGTPAPDWAKSLQTGGAGAAASTTAGSGIVGWLAVPVAAAAVVAAVMLVSPQEAAHVATEGRQPIASPNPNPVVVDPGPPASGPRVAVAEPVRAAAPVPVTQARPMAAKRSGTGRGVAAKSLVRGDARPRADFAVSMEHTAKSVTSEASAVPPPAPQPLPAASEKPATQERIAREPAAATVDDARLEREMGMLAMAQRVLRTDPERALKLARQGEAEFRGSMFTQERQQLLLLSLVELGRLDDARQLAGPYLARFPNGPFSDRVRRALASGKVER